MCSARVPLGMPGIHLLGTWPRMAMWVIESRDQNLEYRRAVDAIVTLNGPVVDVEAVFTNLDLGGERFEVLQRGNARS